MKPSIAADRPEFERWLVGETAAYARIVEKHEREGCEFPSLKEMTKWRFIFFLEVLARYADRDPADLEPVAADNSALWEAIRNGPSLLAKSEALMDKLEREGKL